MKKRIVVKPKGERNITASRKYIKAAEDDFDMEDMDDAEDGALMDALDDVADDVEDLQDTIDDMQEDDVDIMVNNNITDHYIAECNRCKGVFISAVVGSDQIIDHVSGKCPLCGRETEQYLKWIIKDA